ncbi:MAG: glycosyltransferase family protein [Phycisphaerales bacterium]|nr:MAG: glycosyltransferase family protein [Phycisphaerales bacterium]
MIAAIIQARMPSTRLPGKVLKEVMGKPLLGYLIERLGFCRHLDEIIIATTLNEEDEPIVLFAESNGVRLYRGSEHDVLDRFYQAAKEFTVEHILRITGDCPLIDPQVCDRAIEVLLESGADVVHSGPTFAEGSGDCEVLSFKNLEKAWREATLTSEREHVTTYLYNNSELFKQITLVNETDDSRYRVVVDEKEDFLVVKAILEDLYGKGSPAFTINDIKEFLDAHPDIHKLNEHIVRNEGLLKSLEEDQSIG